MVVLCAGITDGVSRILYEEVNDSDVEIINVVSSTGDSSGVDEYRYPRPGTTNSVCSLHVAVIYPGSGDGSSNQTGQVRNPYMTLP